jgi:ribonuclease VapC
MVTVPQRPPLDDLVVDTSAVIALLFEEPDADAIARALDRSRSPVMSAATLTELFIVAEGRRGAGGAEWTNVVLERSGVTIIPVDHHTSDLALTAWRRFGKGRHPAALNFGDCFSYALAVHFELPLLCVGNDFARTDLTIVDLAAA